MPLQHICWMVNNMKTINELVNMHLEDVYAAIKSGKVDADTFLEFITDIQEEAIESTQEGIEIDLGPLTEWADKEYPAQNDWDRGYEFARVSVRSML